MEGRVEVPAVIKMITRFISLESSAGIILVALACVALVISNSPFSQYYLEFLSTKFTISFGQVGLSKPLILWINDGLMAIFFLLVGLEIKREVIEGELNSISKASLPVVAATGGMIIPALFYAWFNWGDAVAIHGWAIPAATDIAFALGLLSLLGSRVPIALKVFLTALAIIDDLGAIVIIALFYTSSLSWASLGLAGVCLIILFSFNRRGISSLAPYAIVGLILWVCVLKSGVHATLAGVALAMAYPIRDKKNPGRSPLRELEGSLHPWVAYAVLPLFAFANAGVPFTGLTFHSFIEPVPLGIILGLFLGKQIGVMLFSFGAVKTGIAKLPEGATWPSLYGISILCGIGFTMSLFIGSLAFVGQGVAFSAYVRLGVLTGSVLSGIVGYILLSATLPPKKVSAAIR